MAKNTFVAEVTFEIRWVPLFLPLFRKLNLLLALQLYSKLLISNFESLSSSFLKISIDFLDQTIPLFFKNSSCLELETIKRHFSVFNFFQFPKVNE